MVRTLQRTLTAVTAVSLLASAGCGTLLHPERQGQTQGRIDPAILMLDGALLVVFLVPGLMAFGVDFYTGAIYMPTRTGSVERIETDDQRPLTRSELEALVLREAGVRVELTAPGVEVHQLAPEASSAELEALVAALAEDPEAREALRLAKVR